MNGAVGPKLIGEIFTANFDWNGRFSAWISIEKAAISIEIRSRLTPTDENPGLISVIYYWCSLTGRSKDQYCVSKSHEFCLNNEEFCVR